MKHQTAFCLSKLPFLPLTLFLTGVLAVHSQNVGVPKTSTHASYKPADFERIAVYVKPLQTDNRGIGGGGLIGMQGGGSHDQPVQLERFVDQRFVRVVLGKGYTLVSRMDLDAAIKEKGLDKAGLTDEKLTAEAGRYLHVSAILVVSIDSFKTSQFQKPGERASGGLAFGGVNPATTYYQAIVSVGARLVKISDNMVMWTGDLSTSTTLGNPDQASEVLGTVAEAVAKGFPKFEK